MIFVFHRKKLFFLTFLNSINHFTLLYILASDADGDTLKVKFALSGSLSLVHYD